MFDQKSPAAAAAAPVLKKKSIGMCRALYDYDAQSDLELSFKERDLITILEKDESGWWHGELNGVVGVFPAADWVEEGEDCLLFSLFGGSQSILFCLS